jgi:hypothetical protein
MKIKISNNYFQYKPKLEAINTHTHTHCTKHGEKIKINKNYLLNKSEPGAKNKVC